MKLNFNIDWDLIKRTHLIKEIDKLKETVKNQNLSLRAYRGRKTKRKNKFGN